MKKLLPPHMMVYRYLRSLVRRKPKYSKALPVIEPHHTTDWTILAGIVGQWMKVYLAEEHKMYDGSDEYANTASADLHYAADQLLMAANGREDEADVD